MRIVAAVIAALLGFASQGFSQTDADDLLAQFSKVRLDKNQILHVRDISLRRDAVTIALNRGLIAFLEPVNGKITGAVFIGNGEVVALPPDSIEKQQIYKFTGLPILNQSFENAVFHFTDGTAEEIKAEVRQHADEEVTPDDVAEFDSWDKAIPARSKFLDLRILADFIETPPHPFFLAELNGEKAGWFDVLFDTRAVEEVAAFKSHDAGNRTVVDLWTSFNQRSEARNPEAAAHKNKAPTEILRYDIESNTEFRAALRLKGRIDGARVLTFDLAQSLKVTAISTEQSEAIPFYQYPGANAVTVVLPRPLNANQELTLRFSYAGTVDADAPWYPSQPFQNPPILNIVSSRPVEQPPAPRKSFTEILGLSPKVAPAGYHDEWLFEGLDRYLAAMYGENTRDLLESARSILVGTEEAGPIWLGRRLASTLTPAGYNAVPGKGAWIVHMLRMLMRVDGPDPDSRFKAMLREFVAMYGGKTASTWDFKHLAEKYLNPAADARGDKKLDWFFDEWVFGTGIPKYAIDYKVEAEGNAFVVSGTIKQSGVPEEFIMPVAVFADDELLGRVLVSDPEAEFRFKVAKKPKRVFIDSRSDVLTQASAQ
jgi:hypothetical protein